jgi:hypothetical protein
MKVSLRLKIVGGYGLMLALIAILGWVTLSLFSSVRNLQEQVFDDAVPGLVIVDEIVRSYTAQSAAVRGALIVNPPVLLAQYRNEVDNARFYEERARDLFRSEEERELLTQLIEAGRSFQALVDEEVIPRISETGQRSQAGGDSADHRGRAPRQPATRLTARGDDPERDRCPVEHRAHDRVSRLDLGRCVRAGDLPDHLSATAAGGQPAGAGRRSSHDRKG